MTDLQVRRLGDDDLRAMRDINRLFAEVFGMAEEYSGAPPSDAYLEDLLADPKFVALGGYREERLIGALTAYELRKYEQQRSEFYIYDLAVLTDCQRQGVGTALIEQMRSIAKDAGAWTIMVQADWQDEAPVSLYAKLGRREDIHHFDIKP